MGKEPSAAPDPITVERILKVGSQVFVYIGRGREERKVSAHLLGWQEGRFLLLSLPVEGGRTVPFPAGRDVILRYVLEGEVFGLRSRVLKVQFEPVPLLFLSFPSEIENVPLRSRPRVSVRLPTVASWLPGKGEPKGVCFGFLRDVTPDGGLLQLELPKDAQPKGRSVHVTFLLGQDEEVATTAQVRNVSADGEAFQLGISFKWSNPEDRERVEVFCRLH